VQTLDFIVQPHVAPRLSLAEDAHFLHAVRRPSRTRIGVLRVYDFAGDMLSLGRYHLVPDHVPASAGVGLHRRLSGGRAIPFGDGFVGVTLVLPHRSALVADDPLALAAYQVMNRYVRGILEGCKLINLAAFYPGRDVVTVNRRILALVSFEVSPAGALLFEAIIANRRDFSVLPALLDAADSAGVIKAEMLTPDNTTCLSRELGTTLSTAEVADMVRQGYEQQFHLACEAHQIAPLEAQAIDATVHLFDDERWLWPRRPRADLDHHVCERVQLGLFEVFFSLEQARFIKDIVFAGDFVANSSAIEGLERQLRLCPAQWPAVDAVASALFAQPENYILGIGPVRTVADAICKGLSA
jgi:lipoate-protein ligase A